MRVLILGRTQALIDAAHAVARAGHEIAGVWTAKPPHWSECGEREFQALAEKFGAPFFCGQLVPEKLPPADVAISVNWPRRITSALDAYRYGILNAHAGDLPRYRGRWPISWAILSGESKIGLCVHRMTGELDAGPIHCRSYYHGTPYFSEVWWWVQRMIPDLFVQALAQIGRGEAPYPQSGSPVRCFSLNAEIDGRIDWTQRVEEILRKVRAFSEPLPGAYTTFADQKVIIWRAERLRPVGSFRAMPGQICTPSDVACGDGMIRLTQIEAPMAPPIRGTGRERFV